MDWRLLSIVSIFIILFCRCEQHDKALDIDIAHKLSVAFPRPFAPICNSVEYSDQLREFLNEEIFLAYHQMHNALYKEINYKAYTKIAHQVDFIIQQQEQVVRNWFETRLLLNDAFYNLLEKNLSTGVALAESAILISKNLDNLSRVDAYIIMANLKYHFLNHEESLLALKNASELVIDIKDLERKKEILFISVMNHNNNNQLDKALSLLDSIDSYCLISPKNCFMSSHLRGINYYFRDNEIEASKNLKRAMNLHDSDPCSNAYVHARTSLELANSLRRSGEFILAEKYYSLAIDIYNNDKFDVQKLKKSIFNIPLLSGKAELITDRALKFEDVDLAKNAYDLFAIVGFLLRNSIKFDRDSHIQNEFFHNFYYSYIVKLCVFLFKKTHNDIWLQNALNHLVYYKSSSLARDLQINKICSADNSHEDETIKQYTTVDRKLESILHANDKHQDSNLSKNTKLELMSIRNLQMAKLYEQYPAMFSYSLDTIVDVAKDIIEQSENDSVARIYYYVGSELYNDDVAHAIIISSGEISHFSIENSSDVLMRIDTLYSWLSNFEEDIEVSPRQFGQLTNSIYLDVIKPALKMMGSSKAVHIVPDNSFCKLPFGCLVTENYRSPENFKNFHYFLEEYDISYGYLIPDVNRELWRDSRTIGDLKNITSFAWSNKNSILTDSKTNLPELPGSFNELKSIERIFANHSNLNHFTGFSATIENFLTFAPYSNILHIAMHARSIESGRLSGEFYFRKKSYSDTLYSYNLLYKGIAPALVVLSSCETNAGASNESEGIFSLSRSFYKMGSKNVVSNMWKLDDALAANFFSDYYLNVKNTGDFVESLSLAKKSFIASCSGDECYPGAWAGIVIHR